MFDASLILGIFTIAYLVFFRPKIEAANDKRVFDNRVLGFIDGLYASGMKFGCTNFEMRSYVRRMLEKAHSLPNDQLLLHHSIPIDGSILNQHVFRSYTGLHGEHICFALLCIIAQANPEREADLIAQCESMLIMYGRTQIPY